MPKYRKLHTKLTESFDFAEMPDDFTRLMWVMLPLTASRDGTLPAHTTLIMSKLFPLRKDVESEQVQAALDWYAAHDMIRYYDADGRRYLWIVNFAHYQGVTTKEAESEYPPIPDELRTNSGLAREQRESSASTDAVFSIQYADAGASAAAAQDEKPLDPDAVKPFGEFWQTETGSLLGPTDAYQLGLAARDFTLDEFRAGFAEARRTKGPVRFPPNYVTAICQRLKQARDRPDPGSGKDDLARTWAVLDRMVGDGAPNG